MVPANPEFGDLASSISFLLAKHLKTLPSIIVENIIKETDLTDFRLIEKVEAMNGYINFSLNLPSFTALTLNSIIKAGSNYGVLKTKKSD